MLKRSLVLVIALCVARLAGGSAGAADEPQPQARPTLFDLPDPWQADLTLSYQSLGQAGSLQRYRKYHRPADGLFLGEWALRGTTAEGFPFARLSAFGLGADDVGGSLVWHGVNVPASFRWEYDRYRFFADPITGPAATSSRLDSRMQLELRPGGPISAATLEYRRQQLSEPTIARLGAAGLGFSSKDLSLQSSLSLGPGVLDLSYAHNSFDDRTQFQPASETDTWGANYLWDLSDKLSLGASYFRAEVEQTGVGANADTEVWQVQGRYQPTAAFGLIGQVGRRYVDQPITASGYTRQTNTANLRAHYQVHPRVTLRAGFSRLDFERINRAHMFIDTPRRDIAWVNARARLTKDLRLTAKLKQQDLKGVPASGVVGTADISPLYRDDRQTIDVRVSGSVGTFGQGYVFYTTDDVRNASRGVDYGVATLGGGFYAELSPRCSATVDALRQRWDGLTNYADPIGLALNAAPAAGALPAVGLPLTADEDIVTVSTQYRIDAATLMSAHYSKFRGTEGALINDHEFGLAVRRTLKDGLTCGVEWRRAFYDDDSPRIVPAGGLDYSDNLLRVDLTAGF